MPLTEGLVGVGSIVEKLGLGIGVGIDDGLGEAVGVGVGQPDCGANEVPGETPALGVEQSLSAPLTGVKAEGFDSELMKGTVMYDAIVVPNTWSMPISL